MCVEQHRKIISQQLRSWLYDALLCRTLTYPEFKELHTYIAESLSWESLTGVKQLSIFDEIPDFKFEE